WVSVRFDNSVGASLLVSNAEFQGGNVILGPDAGLMQFGESIIERPGLSLSGSINHFDYQEWEQTAVKFTEMSGAKSSDIKLADFLSYADVRVGSLVVVEQELENIQTILSRTSVEEDGAEVTKDSWLVQLENEMISGDFIFPDAETTPWRVSLDYLRFPQDEEELEGEEAKEEDIDILENVIPGELPDLVFSTEEFFIGDKNLGAWEFNLRSNGDAASISDLRMTTPDAKITDNSEEAGANLNWRYSNGMHTSSFTGLFSAGDLAKVLPAWGYDANVESQNAAFTSNLQWSGSPAAFDLDKVIGNVRVAIRNGRFVDVDSGSSRLFGAFSLDSLVRRLQLDFSDLYERGLAYDNIDGRLDFNDGIVRSNGEFVIAGPSSRITIDGELDLVNETIDANMLVNIPFSQNVSVLAGILGAWPIAVSTYIASRIFRNQMDEFTTVVYRLEGPWDNPVSGFEPSEEILEADSSPETDAETTAE
ncbi:MAG: AsmA-like C-terminal region-containing protein, partial [Gammaproteobacteria bacterium]